MKIEKFPLRFWGQICYLLINEETKDTVVVDQVDILRSLQHTLRKKNLTL